MGIPGYAGNILYVDLTNGRTRKESLDPDLVRTLIGGYGVNMLGDAVRDLLDPRLRGGVGRYGAAVKKKRVKNEKRGRTGAA